jgi:osmotically-inducible protein OsmY
MTTNDEQLRRAVISALEWEPSVDAAQVDVTVCAGVVTLLGCVSSYAIQWGAEQAAQRVAATCIVRSSMAVTLPSGCRRDDADITRSAESVLRWMTVLPTGSVQVAVEAGCITLSGVVDRAYQKQAATGGVRHLMGVTGVSDCIAVRSPARSMASPSMP